jgi:hypothetical protein
MIFAPGVGPCVATIMSDHSTLPFSPDLPIWTTAYSKISIPSSCELSDLYLWVPPVAPGVASCKNSRVCLANNPRAGGDIDGISDSVSTVVEVYNLLLRSSSVDGILNGSCIIGSSVALSASTPNTNEVGYRISFILRLRFSVDPIAIE